MTVRNLSSWKISSAQSFYPVKVMCIGNGDKERAITTYATNTVNTFIIRNFSESIKNGNPAHKSYLHESFFPECIKDIAVGTNESAILLQNGRIMYFTSSKKLTTVQYLSDVKSICCSIQNGFVLIFTSTDGMEFFIEFHPDTFQENEIFGLRRKFNITFEKVLEHPNSWQYSHFKVKELHFDSIDNAFLKAIVPDEALLNNANLFLSIDNNFCSIHIVNDSDPIVNPIVMCTAKIIDFWSFGNQIILLKESGILEILYFRSNETTITRENIFLGSQVHVACFYEGMFMLSNGLNVEYGMIDFNQDNIIFLPKSIDLPGIVAMTYLPEFQIILCLSENCQFYTISIQLKMPNWTEINTKVQRQLSNVKFHLIEIEETFENVLEDLVHRKQSLGLVYLKRNDIYARENNEKTFNFFASCSVTQTPPKICQHDDSSAKMIYIANSMTYDHKTSFFVNIQICQTVRYANDFDTNLWSLCCRWSNYKHENVYVNVKLSKGQLSFNMPISLIIHLQEEDLICFHIDMFISVPRSNIHIIFPVDVNQADFCEMMSVSELHIDEVSTKHNEKTLICSIFIPKSLSLEDLLEFKLEIKKQQKPPTRDDHSTKMYTFVLLEQIISVIHCPETCSLRLITKDVRLMYSFKMHIYQKIERKLSYQDGVKVSTSALKEYCVSKIYCNK